MPFHNRAGNEAQRSSVELRSLVEGFVLGYPTQPQQNRLPHFHSAFTLQGISRLWSTEHKLICVSSNLFRNSGRRHPQLPCFYPHSEMGASEPGACWGPI